MTKTITPHKGGRTARIETRITPTTKAAIESLPVSFADLVEWAVANYPKDKEPPK